MSETWVQEYAQPNSPGPDGEPLTADMADVRELLVQFHDEYHPRSLIQTRTTVRNDRGILQVWRRIK